MMGKNVENEDLMATNQLVVFWLFLLTKFSINFTSFHRNSDITSP